METVRCAIYTRKSSDEGLDKEFNTLEAQREAGENYVKSQVHQGWVLIDEHYDDGGFSGGNMKRPALQRLLKDITAGKVDMIVIYKIDRLTRSLMDFAKMVDIFDQHHCSFVSVTQNFNTSTSMGRLTLNMLLSFAQFEREIDSERVKDKQAASKKKGMWTGGVIPYGYQSIDRKLAIKPDEARAVKLIFEMFLRYKSAMAVCKILTEKGYKDFRRDAIKRMLKNPIYMGKISHHGELYEGQHEAIIDPEMFAQVQEIKESRTISDRSCVFQKNEVGILRGLLTCGCCHTPMTPASCQSHGVRRYYYTSTKAKYYGYHKCHNGAVPVAVMDECILKIITPMLQDIKILNGLIEKIDPDKSAEIYKVLRKPEKILDKMLEREKMILVKLLVTNIVVQYDILEIHWTDLALEIMPKKLKDKTVGHTMMIDLPLVRRKGALTVSLPDTFVKTVNYNQELIKALGKAFKYQKILNTGKLSIVELAYQEGIDSGYLGRLIRLTCLAPDIVKMILAGTQPLTLYLQRLLREDIPPLWEDQRKLYNIM